MTRPDCADGLHCGRHAVQLRLVMEGHCVQAAREGQRECRLQGLRGSAWMDCAAARRERWNASAGTHVVRFERRCAGVGFTPSSSSCTIGMEDTFWGERVSRGADSCGNGCDGGTVRSSHSECRGAS